MKTSLSSKSIAAIAALFVATVLAIPASAKEQHINGSFEGFEDSVVTPPTRLVTLEGIGNASHLGRFFLEIESVVSLSTFYGEGVFEIVTSSGATLYGTQAGQGALSSEPGMVSVDAVLTITGGTGRFAGATGTLTSHRLVSMSTGLNSGTIEGVVILP